VGGVITVKSPTGTLFLHYLPPLKNSSLSGLMDFTVAISQSSHANTSLSARDRWDTNKSKHFQLTANKVAELLFLLKKKKEGKVQVRFNEPVMHIRVGKSSGSFSTTVLFFQVGDNADVPIPLSLTELIVIVKSLEMAIPYIYQWDLFFDDQQWQ
jgi:hypothetical protein